MANRGFTIRDLKGFGFYEVGNSDWSVNSSGSTNVKDLHLVQPGIQTNSPSQLVDSFDKGIPFESREIESPFISFSFILNLTISANQAPDNRATGAQAGKLYLAEAYFVNPSGDKLWWQWDDCQCQSIGRTVPRGQFATKQYVFRAPRFREHSKAVNALINGK